MPVTLSCTLVAPETIKRPRKWIYSCEGRPKSCQVILKAENAYYLETTMPAKFDCTNCCQQALFPVRSEIIFKMELDVDPRRDDDASPTSSEGMKVQLFT